MSAIFGYSTHIKLQIVHLQSEGRCEHYKFFICDVFFVFVFANKHNALVF